MGAKRSKKRRESQQRQQKMKKWGIIVVIVLIIIVALTGITSILMKQSPSDVLTSEISVSEAYQKYNQGVFLLDVRTIEEWEEYHIPETTLIPLDELENRLNELPRDEEIVIVCRSGNRSAQGRDILRKAGFENVTSMAGGLREWRTAGYPTVSGP